MGATNVQAAIAELDTKKQASTPGLNSLAGVAYTSGNFIYGNGTGWSPLTTSQTKIALGLTKADVGLGNVDNTSDINKPVSNAQASADNLKVDKTTTISTTAPLTGGGALNGNLTLALPVFTSNSAGTVPSPAGTVTGRVLKDNSAWAAITAADVGLGNVNNTSDANKPVSTATQTALNAKLTGTTGSVAAGTDWDTLRTAGHYTTDYVTNSVTQHAPYMASGHMGVLLVAVGTDPNVINHYWSCPDDTMSVVWARATATNGVWMGWRQLTLPLFSNPGDVLTSNGVVDDVQWRAPSGLTGHVYDDENWNITIAGVYSTDAPSNITTQHAPPISSTLMGVLTVDVGTDVDTVAQYWVGVNGALATRATNDRAVWSEWLNAGGSTIADGAHGDIWVTGDDWQIRAGVVGGTELASGVVANVNLYNMPTATLKGRSAAGTGVPSDLTAAQAKTMLALDRVGNTRDVATYEFTFNDAAPPPTAGEIRLTDAGTHSAATIVAFSYTKTDGVDVYGLLTLIRPGNILYIYDPTSLLRWAAFRCLYAPYDMGSSYIQVDVVSEGASGVNFLAGPVVMEVLPGAGSVTPANLEALNWKTTCYLSTTANITLSGHQTIDGFTTTQGQRVLVKDQTTQAQNGIYLASSTAWTRATDFNIAAEIPGSVIYVLNGVSAYNTLWVVSNPTTTTGFVLGTNAIVFTRLLPATPHSSGLANAAYTVSNADNAKCWGLTNGTAITITLPASLTVGTEITFWRDTAATVTFVGSGTSIVSSLSRVNIANRNGAVTAKVLSSTRWLLFGDLG